MSAICADPEDFFLFFEDRTILDIRQKLAVTRFVLFFDFSDHAEEFGDVRKTFGFGVFREIFVHFRPLIIFTVCGGFQIVCGVGNFSAVQQLKPNFGMLLSFAAVSSKIRLICTYPSFFA